jgi:hypothetical protein
VHGISPALDTPALLSPNFPLLQVGKLPEVVNGVQLSDLHEPSSNTLHDFTSRFETPAPVRLPFQQISWVQCVRAQLKNTTKLTGSRSWPEREFLHEGGSLGRYEGLEFGIKSRKVGLLGDGVKGGVISVVALVLPNVNYLPLVTEPWTN